MADWTETNAQSKSILFSRCPQEIRDEIYRHVWSGTRLSFGIAPRPSRNSLALLRTCRRMRFEIGDKWLRYVLFNFGTPSKIVFKLARLPIEIISKIRRVRVFDYALCQGPFAALEFLPLVLKHLPGLQLDLLTILGDYCPYASYRLVESLVAKGNGWKELHFISETSEMLAFGPDPWSHPDDAVRRKPQPASWQQVLDDRDTASAKPLVTIYQSTETNFAGSAMDPEKRNILEQTIPPDQDPEDYGFEEDRELRSNNYCEVLIIAKRGAGADYQQKSDPLHSDSLLFATALRAENDAEWKNRADLYTNPYEYNWRRHHGGSPYDEDFASDGELPSNEELAPNEELTSDEDRLTDGSHTT